MNCYYLTRIVILWFLAILGGYGVIDLKADSTLKQPYRTDFHFQPTKNFMNDPNGPMLYKGIYHLFYQYNPSNGSSNGTRVWGHSTSIDLVNWELQPVAIKPQMSSNNKSSWSGSTTILPGNKPIIFFTGLDSQNLEVQNLAVPKRLSDPYLREWVLIPENPVIQPTLETKIDPAKFRDPTTAWMLPDGRWRVLVGSKRGKRGVALLYRSKDFVHWVLAKHPFYSEKSGGMWECPDFYPVYRKGNANIGADTSTIGTNVKHVLKVSLITSMRDVYAIGTYDIEKDAYTPDRSYLNNSSLWYDYGNYYASKTFYDGAKKRRILFGWVKESLPDADSIKLGWAGIQAIPRSIWLDDSGKQLIQWPVSELETMRERPVGLPNKVIHGGSLIEIHGITAAQADVEISFKIGNLKNAEKFEWKPKNDPESICRQKGVAVKGGLGPFGLLTLASKGLQEHTSVFFRIFNANNKPMVLMCSDQSRSPLSPGQEKTIYGTFVNVDPTGDGISLRVLIDNTVVESYGAKGRNVITARAYPTLAIHDKAHLYIFNNATTEVQITGFSAWSMKKAQIA